MAKTGDAYTLSGPALIAADGVESLVRGQLGVALEGEQAITYRFSRASVGTKSNSRSSIPRAAGLISRKKCRNRSAVEAPAVILFPGGKTAGKE